MGVDVLERQDDGSNDDDGGEDEGGLPEELRRAKSVRMYKSQPGDILVVGIEPELSNDIIRQYQRWLTEWCENRKLGIFPLVVRNTWDVKVVRGNVPVETEGEGGDDDEGDDGGDGETD